MRSSKSSSDDHNSPRRDAHAASRSRKSSSVRARNSASYGNESLPRAGDKAKPRRAQEVRQAAHDAHGYKTHGHSIHSHGTRHRMPDLDALDEAARRRREKLQQRRNNKRRASQNAAAPGQGVALHKSRRWMGALAGVLVIAGGVAVLSRPEFNVAQVKIEGAHLTSPQILKRAQASITGKNIARVDLGRVEKFLRSQAPVEDVRVSRLAAWPPQVVVSLEERKPFARVGGGDTWLIVDKSGMPFRRANAKDENLQAIHNDVWKPALGVKLPSSSWVKARSFVQLLEEEQRAGRKWSLRRVYFDKHDFASLRLSGGKHNETLVQLGNDDWRRKLARARDTFAYFDKTGRRASTLNLITYAVPVYTPIITPQTDKRRADASLKTDTDS